MPADKPLDSKTVDAACIDAPGPTEIPKKCCEWLLPGTAIRAFAAAARQRLAARLRASSVRRTLSYPSSDLGVRLIDLARLSGAPSGAAQGNTPSEGPLLQETEARLEVPSQPAEMSYPLETPEPSEPIELLEPAPLFVLGPSAAQAVSSPEPVLERQDSGLPGAVVAEIVEAETALSAPLQGSVLAHLAEEVSETLSIDVDSEQRVVTESQTSSLFSVERSEAAFSGLQLDQRLLELPQTAPPTSFGEFLSFSPSQFP